MKINEPITPEEHALADAEHRRIVEDQQRLALELADTDELPIGLEAKIGAAILRGAAKGVALNPQRQRPTGRPALIPDVARLFYAAYVTKGMSETAALKAIADKYDVTLQAAKRKMGKLGTKHERQLAAEETEKAFELLRGVTK